MERENYDESLLTDIINSIEKYGGKDCLSSIILTGSFGRGEPTYTTEAEGKLLLKSDVEIGLVFPKSSQKSLVERLIRKVASEFTEELNLIAINEKRVRKVYNFNFSIRTPKFKTIFTYDLFNGSRTIWGRDFIGEKTVSLADVDLYEAKRLVANRIGELIYLQNSADADSKVHLRVQWKGKLILAIVSAWLICEGEYVSSYHGQFQKIKDRSTDVESVMGTGFVDEYKRVFGFLRETGEPYEVADDLLRDYIKAVDRYFIQRHMRKPKVNSVSRMVKYLIKYARTGREYGFIGFENNILQALISDYWQNSARIKLDADVWHRVLY